MNGSALAHHVDVRRGLRCRDARGTAYREALERALGMTLDNVIVSTAEHIAPFNVADTVSFLLPQLVLNALRPESACRVLVLGGALVPLDNRQLPRGFVLPTRSRERRAFQLLPQHVRKRSVVLQPAVTSTALRPGAAEFFGRFPWLHEAFAAAPPDGYAGQMSRCMEHMVRRWGFEGTAGRVSVRPLEDIARAMLLDLLEREDELTCRLLFDRVVVARLKDDLHGLFCAWGHQHGSFLFWEARSDGSVGRMQLAGDRLVGEGIEVPLASEPLHAAVAARRLWPGVFVSLCLVSMLPGIPVSGGPKQMRYYRRMLDVASRLLDRPMDTELCLYGYMCLDPAELRPAHDAVPVARGGTGLDLVERPADAEFLRAQLAARPPTPFSWDVTDRYD